MLKENNRFVNEEFIALMEEKEAISKKLSEVSKDVLKKAAEKLFKEVPVLAEVCWEQYTPYYSDGDSCIFSVRDIGFISQADVNEAGGDSEDVDDKFYGYNSFYESKYNQEIYDRNVEAYGKEEVLNYYIVLCEFDNFINNLGDDELRHLYGDHVRVRMTASEIIIDECDHD